MPFLENTAVLLALAFFAWRGLVIVRRKQIERRRRNVARLRRHAIGFVPPNSTGSSDSDQDRPVSLPKVPFRVNPRRGPIEELPLAGALKQHHAVSAMNSSRPRFMAVPSNRSPS